MNDRSMEVRFTGGKQVEASFDGFTVQTDQGPANGGAGTAPEPYDLFLASLATCAGVYVLGFCQNRGIPHEGIRIRQRWERDDKGRLTDVRLDIEVPPGFPEKYHDALVRVAGKCSVKRTMQDPPEFHIEVAAKG